MTIEDLSARLETVERQNRRLRAGGIAALVLIAAVAAIGQAAPEEKVIRAERFEVVGREGKSLAAFGRNGSESPGLYMSDGEGRVRVRLDLNRQGTPGLFLSGGTGGEEASLYLREDHSPLLELSKVGRAVIGVSPDDDGLAFKGAGPVTRLGIGNGADGKGTLVLIDKDGKVIERLPK